MSIETDILNWFITGQVGMSSKAMAACIAGHGGGNISHPYDPDDFNRCLLFLQAVPEARQHLDKVAKLSPKWARLVTRWDEVEQTFLEEVGLNWSKGRGLKASRTYDLMQAVLYHD